MLLALALPAVADAAIPVNTTVDENNGGCPASCSLRDAVTAANGTAEVVTVPAGTYSLALGPLTLNGVTIQGAGAGSTIISGVDDQRAHRRVRGNAVSGVTITGGASRRRDRRRHLRRRPAVPHARARRQHGDRQRRSTARSARGGGIAVDSLGILRMTNSTVSGNRAEAGDGDATGGGVYVGAERPGRAPQLDGERQRLGVRPGVSWGGGIGTEDNGVLVLDTSP